MKWSNSALTERESFFFFLLKHRYVSHFVHYWAWNNKLPYCHVMTSTQQDSNTIKKNFNPQVLVCSERSFRALHFVVVVVVVWWGEESNLPPLMVLPLPWNMLCPLKISRSQDKKLEIGNLCLPLPLNILLKNPWLIYDDWPCSLTLVYLFSNRMTFFPPHFLLGFVRARRRF